MTATHMPEGRRRWARGIGAGLAAILVATGITGMVTGAASADPTLPPMSASELLNRVATADVDGMSATFSQRSDLGLPTLPSDLGEDLQTVLTLLTGDHTFRVWQAGATRHGDAPVAVLHWHGLRDKVLAQHIGQAPR